MPNNEQLTSIMSELGLDPADPASRKVVERLMAAKPNVPINDRFKLQLRAEIQERASKTLLKSSKSITNIFSSFMNKMLASALIVMIALAAGGFWYIQNRTSEPLFQTPQVKEANQLLSGKYGVTGVAEESFGDLNKVSIVNTNKSGIATLGTEGGKSSAKSSNQSIPSTPTLNTFGSSQMSEMPLSDSSKMIAPGEPYPAPNQYTFKYEGKELPLFGANPAVLKRAQPKQNPSIVDRIVSMLSFGLIDLGKFRDMKIQNFSFVEDREFGYGVNVDMVQGSVSLYQNWENWPLLDKMCVNNNCGPESRITEKDIPVNEVVFAATNAFLSEYGISKEAYASPKVLDSNWRIQYENIPAAERLNFYFPEQVQVVYPLILEGHEVLDESGNPSGLTATYDIRSRKVTGINDLTTKQFEKSQYKGVTDEKKIIEVAEKGGFRNYTYLDSSPNVKTTTLQLETPTVQLVKLWYYDNAKSNYTGGSELYVPALVFPIKNWQKQGYWRSNVIVPLVKDILDSDNQEQPIPVDLPVTIQGSATGNTEIKQH